MNRIILAFCLTILLNSCTQAQQTVQKTNVNSAEFLKKINTTDSAVVLDVRTPGEFEKGHLKNAININWNGAEFDNQLATLDKTKPIFVYCLSGGRSKSAADKMRKAGFENVVELAGGIMDWRANNLPEVMLKSGSKSMSVSEYQAILNSDKLVLVDFYADWCAPCKKMEPYLQKIASEMATKVKLVRIDADEHAQLCKDLKVSGLPVLKLYKNNQLIWENEGYIDEAGVRAQLNKQR